MANADRHTSRPVDPSVAVIAEEVLKSLRRIIRVTYVKSRSLQQASGLTAPQLVVLRTIAAAGELAVSAIARSVSLSNATVTGILDRLQARDLIKRRRGRADRRTVKVSLTPTGQDLVDHTPAPLQDLFSQKLGELEDWEQTQILSALQRVVAMMEADSIEASTILTPGAIDEREPPAVEPESKL